MSFRNDRVRRKVIQLGSKPVKTDVDDQNLAECDFNHERSEFLHEVYVFFWDEFINNDRMLMEAVLEEFKTRWDQPRHYIFVCAGDFAQVRSMIS